MTSILTKKRIQHYGVLIISLILFNINIYLLHTLDFFVLPYGFATGILAQGILLSIAFYEFIIITNKVYSIIWSLVLSAEEGLLKNEYFIYFKNHNKKPYKWLRNRLRADKPSGAIVTLQVFITFSFLLILFYLIYYQSILEPLVKIDERLINLIPYLRSPGETTFFRFITFLADPISMIFLCLMCMLLLIRNGRRIIAFSFPLILIIQGSFVFILKNIVQRTRPSIDFKLITENDYSFPSGHVTAATVVLGFLAYMIFKSFKSQILRIIIIVTYIILVFLVALSRIYLGVHYPTDTFGGAILGIIILSVIVTLFEIKYRFNILSKFKINSINKSLLLPFIIYIIFSLLFFSFFNPLQDISNKDPEKIKIQKIDNNVIKQIPTSSKTVFGNQMETITFIYVGSEKQIKELFTSSGWYLADNPNLYNTFQELSIGLREGQYLSAPVTPAYIDTTPQDLAFEKPTDENTIAKRHHTRIWKTLFEIVGYPVWIATASFDDAIVFTNTFNLPNHQIDPDIDKERDFIIEDLKIKDYSLVKLTDTHIGKSTGKNLFFTKGYAALIDLRNF